MTGIGGSVILGVAASFLIYYFMPRTLAKWRFIRGKIDGDKCTDICDSLIVLDIPTLRGLDKNFVKSNFNEKAKIYHPDKWEGKNYSTKKKEIYNKRWLAIRNAKRILLEYCRDPSYLTKEERKMVIKLFKQAEECGTPMDDAADNLENYFLS